MIESRLSIQPGLPRSGLKSPDPATATRNITKPRSTAARGSHDPPAQVSKGAPAGLAGLCREHYRPLPSSLPFSPCTSPGRPTQVAFSLPVGLGSPRQCPRPCGLSKPHHIPNCLQLTLATFRATCEAVAIVFWVLGFLALGQVGWA
jgi:hypothetical protein